MVKNSEIQKFFERIRDALPEVASKTDEIMRERGFNSDDETEYLWLEALADITNMYIQRRNQDKLRKALHFFSKEFDSGTNTIKNCIDVSYMENLMWDLNSADKKWVWPQIPENLKKLYVAMWGAIDS